MARQTLLVFVVLTAVSGCSAPTWQGAPSLTGGPLPGQNPLFVPAVDREFLWNQTVDALDDHFRIEREQRMQVIGGVITDGTIETFPTTGSSVLEPWRGDSTPGFQRWYATLQSIRRRALVRISPTQGGFLVGLVVTTELDDLGRPEAAAAGAVTLRPDGPVSRDRAGRYTGPGTIGWIHMGRDTSLEQKILSDIHARVAGAQPVTPFPSAAPQ